jgi:hypothetical protein
MMYNNNRWGLSACNKQPANRKGGSARELKQKFYKVTKLAARFGWVGG